MRKLHRALAVLASPFLLLAAVTGLLWAYAPHLYLKQEMPVKRTFKAASVELRAADGTLVHAVKLDREQDVTVDEYAVQMKKYKTKSAFHQWVMRLHRLEFFGTHKELVIVPGTGLFMTLFSGYWLLNKRSR